MAKNTQNDLVQPNERVDDLQNGFYVIQNPGNSALEWMQFFYLDLQISDRMKRFWIWEPVQGLFLFLKSKDKEVTSDRT